MNYPTPHINACPEDIAKTVIMPGDPVRSEFIAKNFLDEAVLINDVRGVHGYTGKYKGCPVTVMASGMGMPSMGIYSYELFNVFGVENIIRAGSAGGFSDNVRLRDIIFAQGSSTDSNFAFQFGLPGTFAPICDFGLLRKAVLCAEKLGISYKVGNVLSTDVFYTDDALLPESMKSTPSWRKMGVLGVEMESAALYMNAARAGKKALTVCTVSDHLVTGERLSTVEREKTFTDMIILSLETAKSVSEN